MPLSVSWVTAPPTAPLPAYCCVVAKRHVVEPFELPDDECSAFFSDAMRVARALVEEFQPVKLNYEIHGNTIPHLHLHLFPRFVGDPFEGGPIDPKRAQFTRSQAELQRLADAIRMHRA
ncbi:MAG: HIT family protein [Actinomycetota bacterium]|nr:HIT family protein [Actinomycetota bacterium]